MLLPSAVFLRVSQSRCSVEIVLYVNVGVEQLLSVRCQIHLIEDEVLKGFLQICFPDEHRSHHPPTTEDDLEEKTKAEMSGNVAECDDFWTAKRAGKACSLCSGFQAEVSTKKYIFTGYLHI